MTSSLNQPRNHDAVLGDQATAPSGSVVLGGLAGIQRRLTSDSVDQRIAALWELQKLGQGLDWIVRSLQDPSLRVQKVAYLLLQARPEAHAQQALQNYSPYALFECLHTLTGHVSGVTAIATAIRRFRYRADQEILISASREGAIKVWDLQAREELFSVSAGTIVYAISIDIDAEVFVAQCKNHLVKAWSLRTEQKTKPLIKPTRKIASVAIGDGRHLISGSQTLVKVWDLHTGREVSSLQGHSSLVTAVGLNEERSLIVSGSEDQTVKVWGIS